MNSQLKQGRRWPSFLVIFPGEDFGSIQHPLIVNVPSTKENGRTPVSEKFHAHWVADKVAHALWRGHWFPSDMAGELGTSTTLGWRTSP